MTYLPDVNVWLASAVLHLLTNAQVSEAASRLNPDEKNVIRSVMESMVLRNTVMAAERHLTTTDFGATTR